MPLRLLTWLASLALHGVAAAALLISPPSASLEEGSGGDQLVVEQGIAIEGLARLGDDAITTEAVEVEPQQASEARPELEEVKPEEIEEKNEIIASEEGPVQEVPPEEAKEVVEPQQKQVATLEQTEQVAVKEQVAAGAAQSGGNTTAHSKYLGTLRGHLEKKKINPRSRLTGTVVIKFTVDQQGELLSREVTSSSGSKTLDEAAISSIEKASPFPPMPTGVSSGPLVVSVPFRFTVR